MPDSIPPFREALRFWLKLGFISFGGPTGQIAIMHAELVERKKWIDERRFLHALNYCMLLPGPEATQLAIYCGWLLHRARGGIAAGVLFVLPSVLLLWLLSWIYVTCGQLPWIAAAFYGLKPAVTAIVAAAVTRLGRRALRRPASWVVAGAAFGAILFLRLPFPAIVGAAALAGGIGGRFFKPDADEALPVDPPVAAAPVQSWWSRALRVSGIGLALWWVPVLVAGCWQGWDGTLAREGIFFSKAAMITFGGAYAALPYAGQQAVDHFGWLTAPQMLDGLGLAETTPGPLIMVMQFIGFLGGWHQPGALSPLMAATLGALITTWTTFVPCFLWIFLGAPHIEQLRGHARLDGTLAAVTASVVGVVLSLAVWFGLHVFFPGDRGVDWFALTIAFVAFVGMQRFKLNVILVILGCGLMGWAKSWLS
ncbi:MAG TPA: chromate efflux transporter [Opitutaceae bacterium]|nr:chromate efflux transporter [Opitutaceae bacterium]